MARETLKVTKVTSDLSGSEGAETVTFAYQGTGYALDLTQAEAQEFNTLLQPYIAVSQIKAKRGGGTGVPSTPEELAAIRDWASKNGHDLKPGTRIPSAVRTAYNEAQGKPAEPKKAPANKPVAKKAASAPKKAASAAAPAPATE